MNIGEARALELLDGDGARVCWGTCLGDDLVTATHCLPGLHLRGRERSAGEDVSRVDGACAPSQTGMRMEEHLIASDADVIVGAGSCALTSSDVVVRGERLEIPFSRCPLERSASGMPIWVGHGERALFVLSRRRRAAGEDVLIAGRYVEPAPISNNLTRNACLVGSIVVLVGLPLVLSRRLRRRHKLGRTN